MKIEIEKLKLRIEIENKNWKLKLKIKLEIKIEKKIKIKNKTLKKLNQNKQHFVFYVMLLYQALLFLTQTYSTQISHSKKKNGF